MTTQYNTFTLLLLLFSLLFSAAMFGFFFAWSCSAMLGLDRVKPVIAIQSMNAINSAVRNFLFGLPFFFTPLLLLFLSIRVYPLANHSWLYFLIAALFYSSGVTFVTLSISEPLNKQLALASLAQNTQSTWTHYSQKWQTWNHLRTLTSGTSLLFSFIASYSYLT